MPATVPAPALRRPAPERIPLADLDPDLAADAAGSADLTAPVRTVRPRDWTAVGERRLSFLILDGWVVVHVEAAGATSAELLGPEDIVLAPLGADRGALAARMTYSASSPVRVAVLDGPARAALRGNAEAAAVVFDRQRARAERALIQQAIAHLTRVDLRVLATLWHLSGRCGRVTPAGVLIPLRLTHRLLGLLVGARRPSVTTAVGELEERGLLVRDAAGLLLRGRAPAWNVASLPVAPLPAAAEPPGAVVA